MIFVNDARLAVLLLTTFCLITGCSQKRNDAPAHDEMVPDAPPFTLITQEHIFGNDRPFPQCHASTLVRTHHGGFLVAWFGGTHEKHDDVGIWMSKGGPAHWSAPVEIAKLREDPHWNPVLFNTTRGEIILFFKVGKEIDTWETWYMVTADEGETWSDPQPLVSGDKGGRGPVRNKPIILSDGSWLAGASKETRGVWEAFTDRSEDQGKTWTTSAYVTINHDSIEGEGVIQPTLWESAPGHVHMLLRSSAGVICRSNSTDYGKTWSPVYKTTMPNPNSGIDLTRLSGGTLVLAYNPDNKNWGARWPISLAISDNEGETWTRVADLEKGDGEDEFSYPAIISFGDTVAGTYTWKRQSVAFWMGTINH